MNNLNKVLLGTITGFVAGAITGVLFAPEKGSTTRKQIKEKSEDLVDEVKAKLDEFSENFIEKFEKAQQGVNKLAENGEAKYENMKKDAKNLVSEI